MKHRWENSDAAVIHRIFHEFTELGYSTYRIAEGLNADQISLPGGHCRTQIHLLRAEIYLALIVLSGFVVILITAVITDYRHSSQDPQDTSIPQQREQIHKWANEHGIEIIEEFSDPEGPPPSDSE